MDFSPKFFKWIRDNAYADPAALRLKYAGKKSDVDYPAGIVQIECRKKFGRKLQDTLASFPDFYFPSTLAGEQASSDILADYHASLVPEGASVVDLTSGLSIDVFHMARRASSVVAVDRNEALVEALRYNADGLALGDVIHPVCADCVDYIDRCVAEKIRFETAFIDPARRASDGSRLFALADCSPDVVSLLPKIAQICRMLVIKASPMLDISHTIAALGRRPVSVAAAGTSTECKELVITIVFEGAEPEQTMIEGVTLGPNDSSTFSFTADREVAAPDVVTSPEVKAGDFICEPYPAVMKSGAFRVLASAFGLRGFHDNTRLLFSSEKIDGFPGVLWEVKEVLPFASSVIKRFKSKYPAISIATRNFGMNADALRGRLGVKESPGNLRLFAVTASDEKKLLIVCSK